MKGTINIREYESHLLLFKDRIAKNSLYLRQKKGFAALTVSLASGLPRKTIHDLERSNIIVSVPTLIKLSLVYSVPLSDLLFTDLEAADSLKPVVSSGSVRKSSSW